MKAKPLSNQGSHITIKAKRDFPLFVFGDHASRHIPDKYDNLGLHGADLTRHIAWDIGTDIIIKHLCEHFGCAGQLAAVSRLVIDLNRNSNSPSLIPSDSDGTRITGNINLSPKERQDRIELYHSPYHQALGQAIDALPDPLIISVHSFTPKPDLGDVRLVDIGLLVKHDIETAHALREMFMRLGMNYTLGINEPYSAYDLNYTIDMTAAPRGLRHLAVEINQGLIDTDAKALSMAKTLADRLEPIVYRSFRSIKDYDYAR